MSMGSRSVKLGKQLKDRTAAGKYVVSEEELFSMTSTSFYLFLSVTKNLYTEHEQNVCTRDKLMRVFT